MTGQDLVHFAAGKLRQEDESVSSLTTGPSSSSANPPSVFPKVIYNPKNEVTCSHKSPEDSVVPYAHDLPASLKISGFILGKGAR